MTEVLLTLASMGLLLIIFLFIFKPETGVLIFFCAGISIQYLEKITFGSLSALDFAGVGIPLLLFIGLFRKKNIISEFTRDKTLPIFLILVIVIFFCGVFFPSLLYPSGYRPSLVEQWGIWAKFLNAFVVMLVVSALFNNEKKIQWLLTCMLISLTIPALLACWQLISGDLSRLAETSGYRAPTAFFHNARVVAYAAVMCYPITLFKSSCADSFMRKVFWSLAGILIVVLIYFTYRRTVWVGLAVQLFSWFFLLQKGKARVIFGYLGLILFGVLVVTTVRFALQHRLEHLYIFFSNIPEVFTDEKYNYLFSGRWGFFRVNLFYFFEQSFTSLILGNGIGGTAYVSSQAGVPGGNHNIYLILLIDFGVACFFIYFWLISLFSVKSIKFLRSDDRFLINYARLFITILTGYLTMGMATHLFYELTSGIWFFWALVGALVGLSSNRQNMRAAEPIQTS